MKTAERIYIKNYLMHTETPLVRTGKSNGIWFVVEHKLKRSRAGYEVRINGRTATFVDFVDAVNFYNNGGKIA